MLSPESRKPSIRLMMESTVSQLSQSISTPRSQKSDKFQGFAMQSPEPKNSRKKAYVNKALFSSNKHCNLLNFDENQEDKKLDYNIDLNDDFELNVQQIEEDEIIDYQSFLTQTLFLMRHKENLIKLFKNPNDNNSLQILSFKNQSTLDQTLYQLYNYIDLMYNNFEIETEDLDQDIVVSGRGSVSVKGSKIKQMYVSILFERNQNLISQMRIQFI